MTPGIRCRTAAAWPARGGRSKWRPRRASDDLLVVLLSGGGSALMALPAPAIHARREAAHGAHADGAGRRHLRAEHRAQASVRDQGRPARGRGARRRCSTLAVSDVVGDDLSVIASGPTVPDDSTFAAALDVLARRGGRSALSGGRRRSLRARRRRRRSRDAEARRSAAGACDGARHRAAARRDRRRAVARREALGYHVHVVAEPVTGEAREVAGAARRARGARRARSTAASGLRDLRRVKRR